MSFTDADIDRLFTFHLPDHEERERYRRITEAARAFAQVIVDVCPPNEDTKAAVHVVAAARMRANAAIATRLRDGSESLPLLVGYVPPAPEAAPEAAPAQPKGKGKGKR